MRGNRLRVDRSLIHSRPLWPAGPARHGQGRANGLKPAAATCGGIWHRHGAMRATKRW